MSSFLTEQQRGADLPGSGMKVIAVIIAGVLVIFCFGVAVHFNQNVLQARKILENERYTRLTAEENLEKAAAQIRGLESEIGRSQAKVKSTEKLLEQAKSVNIELQEKVEEAARLQKSLQQRMEQLQQTPTDQKDSKSGSTANADAT